METTTENYRSKWFSYLILPLLISIALVFTQTMFFLIPFKMDKKQTEEFFNNFKDVEMAEGVGNKGEAYHHYEITPLSVCLAIIASFYFLKDETKKTLLISLLITIILFFIFWWGYLYVYIYINSHPELFMNGPMLNEDYPIENY